MSLPLPEEAGSQRACNRERGPPSAASDDTCAPSHEFEQECASSSMSLEAQAGAGSTRHAETPLERESAADVAATPYWRPDCGTPGSAEDELDDDLEEGDHALCVPEELDGRLGLPTTSSLQWSQQKEGPQWLQDFRAANEESGPGARLQALLPSELQGGMDRAAVLPPPPPPPVPRRGAGPIGRAAPTDDGDGPLAGDVAGDPLHSVLHWMEMANVDESGAGYQSAQGGQHPPGRGHAGGGTEGPLSCRQGYDCLGENARAGSEVHGESERPCPGVPQDEESRPRPPPYAAHVALIRWSDVGLGKGDPCKEDGDLPRMPPPRSGGYTTGAGSALPSQCAPRARSPPAMVDREEDEWMARKKLTGAIGRLVHYREGQRPVDDILGLTRTRYGRIKVTALRKNGTAQSAGVEVGDQLISIDGQTPSDHRAAEAIRTSLKAPSTLVFMGFAGKLQAEVRVRQPDEPRCGLPHFADLATAKHDLRVNGHVHVELRDAVVFQTPCTSLLLEVDAEATARPPQQPRPTPPAEPPAALAPYAAPEPQLPAFGAGERSTPDAPAPNGIAAKEEAATARSASRIYELQREEAKRLLISVRRAVRTGAPIGV